MSFNALSRSILLLVLSMANVCLAAKRSNVNVKGNTLAPGNYRGSLGSGSATLSAKCPSDYPFSIANGTACCPTPFGANTTSNGCNGTAANVFTPVSCCPNYVNCSSRSTIRCTSALKGPIWSQWSGWSSCSPSCLNGTKTRTSKLTCWNVTAGALQLCPGANIQTQTQSCDVFDCTCVLNDGYGNHSCLFPWYYKGVYYPACSTIGDSAPWCATKLNGTRSYVSGYWGYCPSTCANCVTVGGPVVNASCKLPFTYNGVSYRTCTTVANGANNGQAWCATGSTVATQWGICDKAKFCPQGN